ncbi:carboxymuconolactone decarboxylase family protein [Nosocomiicoccus massiliensis]|uniref:Carboxymuconolactone decarboxylase family protein n=1 Tax=Nosocomiicoccus massiliensis TaxID=1232430 RepID=A0AAF0YHS6_9STAP|nr:carboxymuconolactone decarboxylase family protein [Nosocomiicoccus massiliensis]WOS95846.1 carboxymuconolactone decarboxylase family protein [Nosocomiicoccus massiliensis]
MKLYVSVLNGCSYCIEMHYKEASKKKIDKKHVESILNLNIDSENFNAEERVLLLFAKKLTLISEYSISDEEYSNMRKYLSGKDYVDFIMLVNQVNTWNRISIGTGNIGNDINV